MTKRTYTIAFKQEVIEFMDRNNTAYQAAKFFGSRNKTTYDSSMFRQWYKRRNQIKHGSVSMKRIPGGGRKPALGALEEILATEIVELRIMKVKVTRKYICDRARTIADESNITLEATDRWISGFLNRNGFSLRRWTNLTVLSDDELIGRAVKYMHYLQNQLQGCSLSNVLCMDEVAVFFEDSRTQTVDFRGARHNRVCINARYCCGLFLGVWEQSPTVGYSQGQVK